MPFNIHYSSIIYYEKQKICYNKIMPPKSKVIVVLPAFNAEKTLGKTVSEIPREVVDEIILVDDGSTDGTVNLAQKLNLTVF